MKFWLDGQEWDTDKPVYILGYQVIKTWFPMNPKGDLLNGRDYECVARKEYISNIIISHEGARSWVSDFRLTSKDHYEFLSYNHSIVSTSPQKAKNLWKKLLQEKYGE